MKTPYLYGRPSQPQLAFAPMLGISDFPTRLWIAFCGPPSAMTAPYLRATAAGIDQKDLARSLPELTTLRGVLPYILTPQILGNDPAALAALAQELRTLSPVVEVNCGCPTPSAAGPYAGSGILRDPVRLRSMVSTLIDTIGPGACAVKCRVGFDHADDWPLILRAIQDLPLARLSIHGRTRAEGYHGRSRSELIGQAAADVSCPVWLSGDMKSIDTIEEVLFSFPKLSGFLVGRGALANPFIFGDFFNKPDPISKKIRRAAITCYALLHELWLKKPERLLARLASGKFFVVCNKNHDQWQSLIQQLLNMLGAPPCDIDEDELKNIVCGVTCKRLRTIYGYMTSVE